MLGIITRGLVLVLGYAYPGYECYKTVEKNKVEIEELRFWCQYWIIVAILTVFERIGDIFLSWVPLYGEMKLALFIYLWYPKTKGTGYVYETFFRPYIVKHEPEIDRNLRELRAKGWDMTLHYWQNCSRLGQATFYQILQFLAAQSGKVSKSKTEKNGSLNRNRAYPTRPRKVNRQVITQPPVSDLVQLDPVKAHKVPSSGSVHDPEISTNPSLLASRLRRSEMGAHWNH